MKNRKLPFLARLLPKLAGAAAASIILDKMLGGEDPFKISKSAPGLTPIKGLNGAEVLADQVSSQLRSLGFKVNNYPQIAVDARKAVDSGKTLEEAVEEAFIKARDRADIIHQDDKGSEMENDQGPSETDSKIPGPNMEIDEGNAPPIKNDPDKDPENASPAVKAFMKNLLEPGNTVDEIMLKRPEDLTEGEVRQIMIARMDATTTDERERLFKAEKGFFDHFFGNEPAGTDAVGRTMEPKPIRPIPETPKPIATADGEPLEIGLRRIGRGVVRDARGDGLASVIKRLQGGLNLLSQAKAPKDGAAPLEQLKQDGVFGPKSRSILRRAVTALGVPKVEECLALGGFGEFVRDGRKQGFERLREATEKSFATLFRNPAKPVRRPADRVENVTLQETLNDLGRSHLGDDRFTPLKLDGDIGPRTRDSFGLITNALGPERVTKRFGEFLGFF